MKKQLPPDSATWRMYLLVAAFGILPKLPLLGVPLNRDEGAYAYIARSLLRGDLPYRDIVEFKPPLLYALYFPIAVLGEAEPVLLRAFSLLYHCATVILLWRLAAALRGPRQALLPPLLYSLAASDPNIYGHMVSAEMLMNMLAVGAVWLLWRPSPARSPRAAFLAGLALGAAALVKQQAVTYLGILPAGRPAGISRSSLAGIAGAAAVFGLAAAGMAAAGLLSPAIGIFAWATKHIVVGVPWREGLWAFGSLVAGVARTQWPLWGLAALGLAAGEMRPASRRLLLLWTACALAAILIGRRPYQHHLQQLLPPLSLAAGAGLSLILKPRPSAPLAAARMILAAGALLSVWQLLPLMVASRPVQGRMLFPVNAFLEAEEAASWLAEKTPPGARIFIAGSEPQIAWLARRRLAGRYPLMYHLTAASPGIHAEHARWLETVRDQAPAAALYCTNQQSWRDPSSDAAVARQLQERVKRMLSEEPWRRAASIGPYEIYLRR